ncbi:ribosome-associated GTPase EngA [Buchnera aphidicola (Diuraphis noxia)]|uniref:GTPase Der n=1 Tax=Buchnera aphidicola subsp. Diuraphis noxia TaxID=118101 RepID=A0A1B2H9F5_BUCDN|nr:ribosome biogenesis GTPase Der [Buchnera aphidicola]ANZ22776.1 ribosome-associated GTPase EngA [Buchnera aphidicola (Diuraphis noxia)]
MIPIIALIGRTNVGKSTLFNVLTKTRNALVADYFGITRDRQYGYCKLLQSKQKAMIIDTAGLDFNASEIEKKANKQTFIAVDQSNLILFVVSARDGLMPQEIEIIKKIKTYKKEIILVINKIDGIKDCSKNNEFYSLGIKKIQTISASHNQKINDLFKKYIIPSINIILKKENIKKLQKEDKKIEKSPIKVAFIGRPNVGKSTLINNLLKEERMITCNIGGTTLDSISIPIKYKNDDYILIDTAGTSKKKKHLNKFEKISIIKTLDTIQKSNVILFIIDAYDKICSQDLFLSNFIIKSGKSIVIAINKWDLLDSSEKKKMKENIKKKLKFLYFSKIHFISALQKKGIFKLFQSVKEGYEESNKKISTSKLTKTMFEAIKKHQPPIFKGRRIKLKYAHLGSFNPPKIIIHGNQVTFLSLPYKRYLINFFHQNLNIKGTPIQIQFKDNINPYIQKQKN